MSTAVVNAPTSLAPLPPILHRGLTAVAILGFISFLCSFTLFLRLSYKLSAQRRQSHLRVNQFIILIFNLVLADIQQSLAFLLNIHWLRRDAIQIESHACFAQGWFVSTGDLASGMFTLAIAVHSFMDITFDFRLNHGKFIAAILATWTAVYACAVIGIALHPSDFYARAGAWCWINVKYDHLRLYLHYIWVIMAEFGTVLIYVFTFLILRRRVKESFYATTDAELRARSALRLIIAYPIIYVLCTLPLVIARLTGMAGGTVTFLQLCVAAAMITSNGWLDVLLYSLTRKALVFGDEMPAENEKVLDTFRITVRPDQEYGTTTTISAIGPQHARQSSRGMGVDRRKWVASRGELHSRHGSTEELFGVQGVKTEIVVQVRSDTMEMDSLGTPDNRSEREK